MTSPSNIPQGVSGRPLRIGLVAGEVSGDILGAGLVRELKRRFPDAHFEGIAGPLMIEQGCYTLFDMEKLAVMGIAEVLGRLPSILSIRHRLYQHFIQNPPDIFIGIDAPDFNLTLEAKLKSKGITTVHYVSPSVWAWRQRRVFKIRKAVDMVLALLPFEKAFYDRYQVPCRFVGHTLADQIPQPMDRAKAREKLGLKAPDAQYLAILPGSRKAEVELLSPLFLEACNHLKIHFPDLRFVVPLVNQTRRQQFEALAQHYAPSLDFECIDGQSRDVMAAADVVILASGTATLEAMLVGRPMVVCYRFKPLSYYIAKKLVQTSYASLPNLLAQRMLVPELIQEQCQVERIVTEVSKLLEHDNRWLLEQFAALHQTLRCGADQQAAAAVQELLEISTRG